MSMKRTLTLGTLAALTIATAAGCGTTGLTTMAGYAPQAGMINVMGVTRKLGINLNAENAVMAHARPAHLPRQGMLPTATNILSKCPPIYDQGQLGSCTAFAIAKGAGEINEIKTSGNDVPLSALFFYYAERDADGDIDQDGGSTMTQGVNVLGSVGCAPEADWAYDISKFTQKPPAQAYADAGKFKVGGSTQIANLDDIKTAVAAGRPVVFGIRVYQSFESIGSNGIMPMPKKGEQLLGGHAQCVVGYDDQKQTLLVRNSWGTTWGAQGYYQMPYAFVNKAGMVSDIWAVGQ